MGYWSSHPMSGDTPLDGVCVIDNFVFQKAKLEGMTSGKIHDDSCDDPDNCDCECDFACDWKNDSMEDFRKILDKYKYELIDIWNKIGYDDALFALPFTLLNFNIKVKEDKLSDLKRFLGDGGADDRGYPCLSEVEMDEILSTDQKIDNPQVYAYLMQKNLNILFSDNTESSETRIAICKRLESQGLFDVVYEMLSGLKAGEKPHMVNTN